MSGHDSSSSKLYYYFDVDLYSRQIISWDIATRADVEIDPKNGCHRVFVSKGQYNKLTTKLKNAKSDW